MGGEITGDKRLTGVVDVACHDLRTPLAAISGFAKTLLRGGSLTGRDARFVGIIDEASEQIAGLIDQLGFASRIESGRYVPTLGPADTLALAAASGDERIGVEGAGAEIETDADVVTRSLAALALAAIRYGEIESVTWTVAGRELRLGPVRPLAAPVLDGSTPRDLGALVARLAIERLGGILVVEAGTLELQL